MGPCGTYNVLHGSGPASTGLLASAFAGFFGLLLAGTPPLPGQTPIAHEVSMFVAASGARLFTQECGSGAEAILLVHDNILNSVEWNDVWPAFCQRFHTIRYDRRGFGRTPATTVGYVETDDMLAVLKHAGVTRATIVGSAHGGEVAINFALAHPEMVRRLILAGTLVSGIPLSDTFVARTTTNAAAFEKGDIRRGLATWANDRYVMAPGNGAARDKLQTLLLTNPQDLTHADIVIAPRFSAAARLGEIRIPTLVLVGEADITDVRNQAATIVARVRGASQMIVPGVGQLMYLEKPELFAHAVFAFIGANL